jgi:Tol biopolymer transport system component/C-terminal processing protease CtpA/Prc
MRCLHPSALLKTFAGAGIAGSRVLAALSLALASPSAALETIQLPSGQSLSPDGQTLVFAWAGDLWTSSINGGEARRLTYHPAPDDNPRVARDGKSVFFNSDRTGSKQVFRIPMQGGSPEQVTYHSEGSFLEDLHPAKPVILVSGYRDHAGRAPSRLIEKPLDPTRDEKILFDATAKKGRYSPDGRKILFVRSGTQTYRKGYEGSQAARIWIYNLDEKSFEEPVKDESGCRYPLWAPDGRSFYYVTSRSGGFNIWQHRFGKKEDLQLTHYPNDSIFSPTLSRDGSTLVYRHLFDLHALATKPGGKPSRIPLFHRTTMEHPESEALTLRSTNDATVTPKGLEWAFVAGGEIWAMDTVLKEPHRLTDSPAHETDLYFAQDGKYLYYQKDNGINVNYWRMSRIDQKKFWWTADEFHHEPVTKGEKAKWGFQLSPDEKHISYIEYPGTLWLAKADGSSPRRLLSMWDAPSYVWSPDGKYLAYAAQDENYNSDIFIISTDGKGKPVNVSRHPDSDSLPRWSPDGKILAFVGRHHSDATDLFFVHLDRKSHFRSDRDARIESARKTMSQDPNYKTEKKKEAPEEKKKEEGLGKKILKGLGLARKDDEENDLDLEDLHKRVQRIPLNGLSPSQLHWMPDSKSLIFQSGGNVHRIEAKAGARASVMAKASGTIVRYKDDDKIYLVSGGMPAFLNKGRLSQYPINILFDRDREHYQRMGYRIAWRTLRDRFYDPRLNNRDWDDVRTKYELAAAQAKTKEEFAQVMSLLLGELNSSHMGFYPGSFPKEWSFNEAWRSYTPHLGVRLDERRKVIYVHPNGPADRPKSRLKVGDLLLKIDGQPLRSDVSLTQLLNGRLDRDIIVTVNAGEDEEEREVTIRPISHGQARALAQAARLDRTNEMVEEATEGKLGYLHVARMMWDEFEKFEHHIYERGAGKDGLIIDVRDNGGGFTADHLLTVLTQPLHAYTVGRNGSIGYPQDRTVYASWTKPVVVICNENSFSNAEIFSHAIKTLNRGKVVGIPTAGGVISTGSANILGLGRMRLPGRGWFLPHNGEDMELHGAVPHVIIDVRPDDLPEGRDPQLEKAIEVLKTEVKERTRKVAPPIYRSER